MEMDRTTFLHRFHYGASICDEADSAIGIRYSMPGAVCPVSVSGNYIGIDTPGIDTCNKYEDGKLR